MVVSQTFRMRYGPTGMILIALGAGPKRTFVTIDGDRLRVKMGWLFSADIPLSSIARVGPDTQFPGGIGAHGWRGNWLVNGSVSGRVRLEIDPAQRARATGVPVKLRVLRLSMESPEELIEALANRGVQQDRQHD
jgi:hypothetical protein